MSYYRVYLGGQGLQDLAPGITVTSIQERGAELEIQQSANAKYQGTHVIGMARRSKEILIKLWIKDRTMERRARTMDLILEWASRSGALTVNYRPHQRMNVTCTGYPALGGDWKWVEEAEITFTAHGVPFWEDENLTTASLPTAAAAAELAIQPPGTAAECFLRWDLVNSGSGTLTALTLQSAGNGSFIALEGLAIPPAGRVVADYDLNGYLTIKDGSGNSLLNKRTAASYDDVILKQRTGNTIRLTANQPLTGLISARGLYL